MAGGVVFRSEFDDGVKIGVGFRVDIMDTEAATKAITGITVANPGVVTAVAHGYSNGDKVYIFSVVGMTEVNYSIQTVANKAADTFEIEDTSGFTAYTSGGTSNTATEMDGGSNPLGLQYDGQNSNKYGIDGVAGVIKKSIATFVLEQTIAGQFDNVLAAEDDRYEVYVYKDFSGTHAAATFSATGNLYWSGNLIPENISEPYNTVVPYSITFIAKDGLERLKDIDFENAGATIKGRQSALTTLMFCLNLLDIKDNPKGAKLGIYEAVNIYEAGMDDALDISPLGQADIDPEIFRTSQDEAVNCEEVVSALCLGFQFRLYQSQGKWNIERVNQLNGTMERRLFDTSEALLSTESAYDPIIVTGGSTALLLTRRMVRKSWKSAKAIFNAGQVVNLIPDGEFEDGAFASASAFVSGGWTISGSATIEKTEVNQPGSEYAVRITSEASGVGDYIESAASKLPTGNEVFIQFKTKVDVIETSGQVTAPEFHWMLSFLQSGGTTQYLKDFGYLTISNVTQANPGVVTTFQVHGLSANDKVLFRFVVGMVELNDNLYKVSAVTSTTFELKNLDGTDLDTSGFTAYTSGGRLERFTWTEASTTNQIDITQFNAWTDHKIGPFLAPDSGDAGDLKLRLYEIDPNDYTLFNGILYDRVIGTIGPGGSLPVEIHEVTAEISSSGSTFKHDGFDLKFGDVAGFANQDYVLPVHSRLVLSITSTLIAGDFITFDIATVARTFTIAAAKSITAITKANPAVVTSNAHGFSDGNTVFIWNVVGMTEINGDGQLGKEYVVANKTANTFELQGEDSTNHTAYTSGGKIFNVTSQNWEDGKSLRNAIKQFSDGNGYKVGVVGSAPEILTVLATAKDSTKDFGTVTIDTGNGSDFSKTLQTDAIEAEATVTSRPLSKGAISINGDVSSAWYEKGDAATDTDEGGTNVSHIKMILLGILRNYGVTTKKHTGKLADMAGDVHFGSVIHDPVNDNGVYFSFNGVSSNEKRLEWTGELIQHSNASPTLAYTTVERTVGENINNRGQASPFIIGPTVTETINQSILTGNIGFAIGSATAAQIKGANTTPINVVTMTDSSKHLFVLAIHATITGTTVAFDNKILLRYISSGTIDLFGQSDTASAFAVDDDSNYAQQTAGGTSSIFHHGKGIEWFMQTGDSANGDGILNYTILYTLMDV